MQKLNSRQLLLQMEINMISKLKKGFSLLEVADPATESAEGGYAGASDWFFQMVFVATAAVSYTHLTLPTKA